MAFHRNLSVYAHDRNIERERVYTESLDALQGWNSDIAVKFVTSRKLAKAILSIERVSGAGLDVSLPLYGISVRVLLGGLFVRKRFQKGVTPGCSPDRSDD